jgi:hypothetical protein
LIVLKTNFWVKESKIKTLKFMQCKCLHHKCQLKAHIMVYNYSSTLNTTNFRNLSFSEVFINNRLKSIFLFFLNLCNLKSFLSSFSLKIACFMIKFSFFYFSKLPHQQSSKKSSGSNKKIPACLHGRYGINYYPKRSVIQIQYHRLARSIAF